MRHLPARELFINASPASAEELTPLEHRAIARAGHPLRDEEPQSPLEAVLSRARVGILHCDLDRRILLVNEAFCSILGRSADELEGVPFERLTHPDDVERSNLTFRTHLADATPFEIEKRYVRPDGKVTWCSLHVSFVLDSRGQPQSIITVASDITARRTAEDELRESEAHYRHTVELNPQISWIADPTGAILEVSSRWHEITGVSQQGALGTRWLDVLHPDDVAPTRAQWQRSLATGLPVDVEYRLRNADGTYRWCRSRAAPRIDPTGAVVRWYGTLEDIHERRVAQDALRDSEGRFRLAAQAAGLGIWDYDALRDRREWSAEFKAMLGLDQSTETSVALALSLVIPEDRYLLQALVDSALAGDSNARFEVTLRIRRADDGAQRWMRTDGWRIHAPSGRLERVLVTIRDVTEERTAEERIRWTATHDALTRIPNRAFFTERLEHALERAEGSHDLVLVLLDIDHLKEVNDTIGHDAGDVLLRTFATRLHEAFGPEALVGRLGGDEFAVLLERMALDQATIRVARALELLRQPFEHEGHSCDTQATAGLSVYPANGGSAQDLLKSADIALYAGKGTRRGELSIFEPAMRADIQRRASMLNVARTAVRDDLVVPFYQPKVSLATRRVVGCEALLRWRHAQLGIQGPDTIATAFEDFGLALALGDRMLDRIALDLRRWLDQGFDPGRVAINLSPAEFRHEGLAERVLRPFARLDVPFDRIEVEITETVLLGRDTERVGATLASFHANGVTMALDDFGTGYASLSHLKMFPVNTIKIDKSFVGNLAVGSDDAAIVDAVIGLAHQMNIDVVAEGVEREDQARYLTSRGCTYGQGYLFGRPMPADDLAAMLRG